MLVKTALETLNHLNKDAVRQTEVALLSPGLPDANRHPGRSVCAQIRDRASAPPATAARALPERADALGTTSGATLRRGPMSSLWTTREVPDRCRLAATWPAGTRARIGAPATAMRRGPEERVPNPDVARAPDSESISSPHAANSLRPRGPAAKPPLPLARSLPRSCDSENS